MPRSITPRSPVQSDRCKCLANPLCADPGDVLPITGPTGYPVTFPPLRLGAVSGERNSVWPIWAALLSLLLLAFSAVSAKAQTVDNAKVAVVQRYFDAWNSGDIAALRATLAPSVEYFNTSNETVKAGVDAVTEVPVLLSGMMPDRKLTLLGAPVANGDQVAVQWSFKATHPSGVKGQGPVTFRGASFFRIEQGRIVWIGDYYNHATLERQLAR
jgi:ketosteroid isomerase-like protein